MNKRAGAILMTIGAIVSVQFGASFAKSLFATAGPLAMVFLRQVTAALLLWPVARPRRRGHSRADWLALAAYAASLVTMNAAIYAAFAHIPIGLAVTIEFLGPLAVAIGQGRGRRDLVWAGLAAVGVVLLGWSPGRLTVTGVAFALVAATAWACYILASPGAGRRWPGVQAVCLANSAGALVFLGPVLALHPAVLAHPHVWAAGAAVGLLNSVIPYSLEIQALRHLEQRVFSILMSLEPAVAALAAFAVLREALTVTDCVAMACVVVASAGITATGRHPGGPAGAASRTP
ncbi:MAG: EamA family transporter [Propionibacteriaceae bacterium]|nr:EamA family transporter [Propionibacteriaceae bacterium]